MFSQVHILFLLVLLSHLRWSSLTETENIFRQANYFANNCIVMNCSLVML